MTTPPGKPVPPLPPTAPPSVVALPISLRLQGAIRLLPERSGDPTVLGQRFIESARLLGIDLGLMFGTLDSGGYVRQVCLAVPGAGGTAMLFLSSDTSKPKAWPAGTLRGLVGSGGGDTGLVDRVALIAHACEVISRPGPTIKRACTLVQALLEPREKDVAAALAKSEFISLGELAYLRRPLSGPKADPEAGFVPEWTGGIQIRSMAELLREGRSPNDVDALLGEALERSYEDTLDCPELCGMRNLENVIESHRSVGEYDPSLWWLVFNAAGPQGCLLLSVVPEQDSVELVYIGLSPAVRGKGLASNLMGSGIAALYRGSVTGTAAGVQARPAGVGVQVRGTGGLTCAVDMRNQPALRLYQRLGFVRTSLRLPWVKSLRTREL